MVRILTLAMILLLAGCGSSNELEGKWSYNHGDAKIGGSGSFVLLKNNTYTWAEDFHNETERVKLDSNYPNEWYLEDSRICFEWKSPKPTSTTCYVFGEEKNGKLYIELSDGTRAYKANDT